MTTVFVSYRRQDSADICDRITNHLEWRYGKAQIFRDVTTILAGSDFDRSIQRGLDECRVMLVLIGPGWVEARGADGQRRLDDPRDYVRREVATALRERKLVIPVLVRGAYLPHPSQLPADIAALAQCRPFTVRGDPAFQQDMAHIYRTIDRLARRGVGDWPVLVSGIIFSLGFVFAQLLGFTQAPVAIVGLYVAFFALVLSVPLALLRVFTAGQWAWLPVVLAVPLTFAGAIAIQPQTSGLAIQAELYYAGLIACAALQITFGVLGPSMRRANLMPQSPLAWRAAGRRIVGMAAIAVAASVTLTVLTGLLLAMPAAQRQQQRLLVVALGASLLVVMVSLAVGAVLAIIRTSRTRQIGWLVGIGAIVACGFLPGAVCVLLVPSATWGFGLFVVASLILLVLLLTYGIRSWRRGLRTDVTVLPVAAELTPVRGVQ